MTASIWGCLCRQRCENWTWRILVFTRSRSDAHQPDITYGCHIEWCTNFLGIDQICERGTILFSRWSNSSNFLHRSQQCHMPLEAPGSSSCGASYEPKTSVKSTVRWNFFLDNYYYWSWEFCYYYTNVWDVPFQVKGTKRFPWTKSMPLMSSRKFSLTTISYWNMACSELN